jgi:nicotinate phosphoribosyltransferase
MSDTRLTEARTGLQTEFQQLVQAAVYHADGLWGEACFDLYAPTLPLNYGFLVASGIDAAIDSVLRMRFTEDDVAWLQAHPAFGQMASPFFESLRQFRFQGDIWSVPEGSIVFPGEPIVQVRAPLHQACLLETPLTQRVSLGTGVSSRAARMVLAAAGHPVVDLSARRCSGPETALHTSRSAWIGGVSATSNADASCQLGIPPWQLISDTLLAAYDTDLDAYEAYRQHFPRGSHVHLPDNDVAAGMEKLAPLSASIQTVRLDSSELLDDARRLRQQMDQTGFSHSKIMGCGSLDASLIALHRAQNSAVDIFGVDDSLAHEAHSERLNLSYRIAELVQGGQPVPITRHWSSALPGTKQVVRLAGMDKICLDVEASDIGWTAGRALLRPMVLHGERSSTPSTLREARERCKEQLSALPRETLRITDPTPWPVGTSRALAQLIQRSSNG